MTIILEINLKSPTILKVLLNVNCHVRARHVKIKPTDEYVKFCCVYLKRKCIFVKKTTSFYTCCKQWPEQKQQQSPTKLLSTTKTVLRNSFQA